MKQEWYETKNQALDRLRKLLRRKKKIKSFQRLQLLENLFKAAVIKKLKAVVLRGMTGHDSLKDLANKFYNDIAIYLEQHGYDVYFDDAGPNEKPIDGDLWIGHCLAANRFKFAPKHTYLVALDSPKLNIDKDITYVNHPVDVSSKSKGSHEPDKYHYIFTDNMKKAISQITVKILLEKVK